MTRKMVIKNAVVILSGIISYACTTSSTAKTKEQTQKSFEYIMKDQNHYNSVLMKYSNFKKTSQDNVKLQIDFSNKNFSTLKNKYELDKIAGNSDDLSKALKILFWLCEHTYHNGAYTNHVPPNALDLLEFSFDKGENGGINCKNLAYILTECLLSIGLPARTVFIYPFSYEDLDNHVVTHVYIKSIDKWIMLDPTWCGYFSDEDGNILNLIEMRNMFANNSDIYINDAFSYNGKKLAENTEQVQWYKRYMAKNTFYFNISEISTYGQDNTGRDLYVCPLNFDVVENTKRNLEYRLEWIRAEEHHYDEPAMKETIKELKEYFTKAIEELSNLPPLYLSPEKLLASP